MRVCFEDVWSWSVYSNEKRLDFNGYVIRGEEETVLVDPPEPVPEDMEKLRLEPQPYHIVLTNRDHLRAAEGLRGQLGARLWIHEADAEGLDTTPDATFQDGDELPGGMRAVHVPDSKSPGETALYLARHDGILILGDALIGNPIGELRLLPDSKFADPAKARRGIEVLLDLSYGTVLVGDGTSIFRNGRDAVRRFLEEG
jgi:hypothetical protein